MTNYVGVVPTNPIENQPTKDIQLLTEWSTLEIVAVFLIRHLLVMDKMKREADNRMLQKLLDDALEDD